ncbi:MAG: chromosome segregation protein SMC [Gammaproteobacteria bacterium]
MQLKKIKLAGFKSFVDPTVVLVPSKLVAVVGPNGCGKSNIIDAVSWVMGESSAKYLRGESLTDVIFNGSSARKPVGQASVELIFDNQDGSLGGEFGSYSEISIRRVITREADSSYFLNGTRCRRRDIIDIFLGTGLGPRSYSIIGQNMISRIIEAKPDDMRVYLEEAAGVSKYKERRRETENRINHTKENLARLNDIRTELEKQLGTLKRQANAAERFKTLKQEERNLRAQWLGIQWRNLDHRLIQSTLQVQQQETGLEARQAELSEINLQLESKRELQHATTEEFQDVQRRYYAIGSEITRVEQEIRHCQERQQQWQMDVEQADKDWLDAKNTIEEVEQEMSELAADTVQLEPTMEHATQAVAMATEELNSAEDAMHSWQQQWDTFNQRAATSTQTAQVEQTRIQHLEQRLATIKQRIAKLDQEQEQINFTQLDQEIAELSKQVAAAMELTENQDMRLEEIRDEIKTLQSVQQQSTNQLDQVRNQLQRLRGQQASLEALQQTALGQRNNRVIQWLAKHNLDKKPRLAQGIEVESGWERAVEKALGHNLQAVCIDQLSDIAVDEFQEGNLCVFATGTSSKTLPTKADTLLGKVKSQWPLDSLLSGVYAVETQSEALALCASLEPHESVITRDGVWLSATWMRISRDENPEAGVFQREQELKQLAKQISELTINEEELENSLADCREQLSDLESQRDELQKVVHQSHARTAEIQAQQKMQQQRQGELQSRVERIRKEHDESVAQLDQTQTELETSRDTWQQAMGELEHHAQQREMLTQERDAQRMQLQACRERVNQAKEHAHQQEIRLQTTKSQYASLQNNMTRLQAQLAILAERKLALTKDSSALSPIEGLESSLEEALNRRLQVEEELHTARTKVEAIEQELKAYESSRQEVERGISRFRDMLESLRVELQGLKVKSETLMEQINETGMALEDILKDLPEEANADEWHAQLEQIAQRITRLGPINLVAIEEYTSCSERKEYLDRQFDDLQQGLNTLESAIAKIDKETRAKFKETFDKVNERFQELFPKIFGGGRAYLELTGENLLDAGITVMACPPGKRNSTIHLLSGGEKAMTAISLVFSIFHLNPAPFCLLDEVDAPLDDANIGRFCQLVKAMSDKTQFIFISHNKLAIEMGEHLMGVTMHEPGVSRLVSVNVEEAVSLAGA